MTNSTTQDPSLQCSLRDEEACEWEVCRRRVASGFPDSIYFCMSTYLVVQIFKLDSPAVSIDPINEVGPNYVHIFSRDIALQTQAKEVDEINEVLITFLVLEGVL